MLHDFERRRSRGAVRVVERFAATGSAVQVENFFLTDVGFSSLFPR